MHLNSNHPKKTLEMTQKLPETRISLTLTTVGFYLQTILKKFLRCDSKVTKKRVSIFRSPWKRGWNDRKVTVKLVPYLKIILQIGFKIFENRYYVQLVFDWFVFETEHF